MAMQFEDALRAWGAARLAGVRQSSFYWDPLAPSVSIPDITVQFDFNGGFACCGGSDPLCYCSYAESPSAHVRISDGRYEVSIPSDEFDFATVLGEIVAAGGGGVTA